MSEVSYDKEKFRELLLYIAEKSADDPRFGDTKLNKLLYFSDFFAYSHLGRPITGARYQKLEWGPAARALIPVRRELESEGALRVEERGDEPKRKVTVPLRTPNKSVFTEEELSLVDELLDLLRDATATSISAISHTNSPGWQLVDLQDDIPYETALIARDRPTSEVLERGRELADRYGW